MRIALQAKLVADPSLVSLLRATGNHPLLAIKNDSYWGFDVYRGGQNKQAKLWMNLRSNLDKEKPSI